MALGLFGKQVPAAAALAPKTRPVLVQVQQAFCRSPVKLGATRDRW